MGMGCGKTGSTLNAANTLFENLDTKGILVVAPLRVCALTWPDEVQKWANFRLSLIHI